MATEKRLIDANALLEDIKFEHDRIMQDPEVSNNMKWCEVVCNNRATEAIERSPTVDAVEVVHGHWIPIPEYENKRCSVCRKVFSDFTLGYYCPNCGAKMDGGSHETD